MRTWRIVAAFWDPATIALLRIAEHKSNIDLYGTLADELGIPKVTGNAMSVGATAQLLR